MKNWTRRATRFALFLGLMAPAAQLPGQAATTGSIAGRVTHSSSLAPIADARIRAVAPGGAETEVVAGADGTYRISGLAPGLYSVTAIMIGYRAAPPIRIEVNAGETSRHDVELNPATASLDQVVVTASRAPEKVLDAPASVSVILREEIEQRPSLTAVDHLRAVPGVDIIKGGLVQANLAARGFNGAFTGSLLMLQDNRFATVPSLRVNVPFLFTSTNEDIERIEVVLGPAAALYGPGAANGVLHLITKSPFASQGTSLTLDLGERGTRRSAIRHAGAVGTVFGYKLSFEEMAGNEWESRDIAEPTTILRPGPGGTARTLTAVRRDFDVSRKAGEFRLDFRPTANTEIIGSYGMAKIGNALELTGTSGMAQARNWKYEHYQARFRYKTLFAQVFTNLSNSGNTDSLDNRGTFLLRTGNPIVDESKLFAAQIQHSLNPFGGFRLVYGADYINTEPRTQGTVHGRNEDDDIVKETGGYIHATQRLGPKLEVLGALRMDKHSRMDDNVVSPRAALVFKPRESQNIRLTYNQAFNNPATFQFSIDLLQGKLPVPFDIRVLGNNGGYTYARNCTGGAGSLCMRSPFLPAGSGGPSQFIPATAVSMWQAAITVAAAANPSLAPLVPLLRSLSPTSTQIATTLRNFNSGTRSFNTTPLSPTSVTDIDPLKVTRNQVVELGYKGVIASRLNLGLDLWWERRKDRRVNRVMTPNVFLDQTTMTSYLTAVFTGAGLGPAAALTAASVAAGMSGIPLGTVTPDHALTGSPDLLFVYQNIPGTTNVHGADLASEFLLNDRWSVAGTYSWVNDTEFDVPAGTEPLLLNAGNQKASLTGRYRNDLTGFRAELRGRYVNGFPINDGVWVGDVPVNAMFDAGVTFRLPTPTRVAPMLSIFGTNLLNNKRRSWVGVPEIGRHVMTRMHFTF